MTKRRNKISNSKRYSQFERRQKPKMDLSQGARKAVWGFSFILVGIILVFGLLEIAGPAGNSVGEFLKVNFGYVGGWILAVLVVALGLSFFFSNQKKPQLTVLVGGVLFFIAFMGFLGSFDSEPYKVAGDLGLALYQLFIKVFSDAAIRVFYFGLALIGLAVGFNITINLGGLYQKIKEKLAERGEGKEKEEANEEGEEITEGKAKIKVNDIIPSAKDTITINGVTMPISKIKEEPQQEKVADKEFKAKKSTSQMSYKELPIDLLADVDAPYVHPSNVKGNSGVIKRTLQNFGIPVEMGEINVGPTVTQYTLKPAEGVKLSRIVSLQNDLALALAAPSLRIEAPIPGKSLVGIEVPNEKRSIIGLRKLVAAEEFKQGKPLLLPLGEGVSGDPVYVDLASMPHLLVAGATGAGKSVFLNILILSLLWRNMPRDMYFILIDPKRVEFSIYESLPHLLAPVVTDINKIVPVLRWLTEEMDRRFDTMREVKARDIIGYNEIVAAKPELGDPFPYIVLVIDELADVMTLKGKEVEASIVRLSQMARAVGIHLVLATQRPSVEVITGLIKANITARIAFQVASQIDSRTILDSAGAEKLLGKGDMLFTSNQFSKLKRVQSPYVDSKEIKKVVDYLAEHHQEGTNGLSESLVSAMEQKETDFEAADGFDMQDFNDSMYDQAKDVVVQAQKASASLLQRRLRVGYARAARLLDILEQRGVVGPAQGARPREVLLNNRQGYKDSNQEEE